MSVEPTETALADSRDYIATERLAARRILSWLIIAGAVFLSIIVGIISTRYWAFERRQSVLAAFVPESELGAKVNELTRAIERVDHKADQDVTSLKGKLRKQLLELEHKHGSRNQQKLFKDLERVRSLRTRSQSLRESFMANRPTKSVWSITAKDLTRSEIHLDEYVPSISCQLTMAEACMFYDASFAELANRQSQVVKNSSTLSIDERRKSSTDVGKPLSELFTRLEGWHKTLVEDAKLEKALGSSEDTMIPSAIAIANLSDWQNEIFSDDLPGIRSFLDHWRRRFYEFESSSYSRHELLDALKFGIVIELCDELTKRDASLLADFEQSLRQEFQANTVIVDEDVSSLLALIPEGLANPESEESVANAPSGSSEQEQVPKTLKGIRDQLVSTLVSTKFTDISTTEMIGQQSSEYLDSWNSFASSALYFVIAMSIIVLSVLVGLYRLHQREVIKTEHMMQGFLRVELAGGKTGKMQDVRETLTKNAFEEPQNAQAFFAKKINKTVAGPLPGHIPSDIIAGATMELVDAIVSRIAQRFPANAPVGVDVTADSAGHLNGPDELPKKAD